MKRVLKTQSSNLSPLTFRGFTLIEFVVIVSIFAIMAGIGLFNFRGFQTDVSVNNLAHDIAVSIRKVQAESSSALSGDPLSDPANVDPTWRGVYFPTDLNGNSTQEFILFNDIDHSGTYSDISDILIDRIQLQTDDRIAGIDYTYEGGGQNWQPPLSNPGFSFRRPFPEVAVWGNDEGRIDISLLRILLANGDGSDCKAVIVSKIGEISVDRDPVAPGICNT